MSTTTPLAVTADDRARWRRRVMDVQDKDLWINVERLSETPDTVYAYCTVESYTSRTDETRDAHDVYLTSDESGVHVLCDCEYFVYQHGPCVHAAKALSFLKLFPFRLFEQPSLPLPPLIPCPVCGALFGTHREVNQHILDEHTHKCWTCGLDYPSAHQLAVHRALIHSAAPRSHMRPDPAFGAALLAGGKR